MPNLNREIQASPNDAALYARRAECYKTLGDGNAELADWDRAIELTPGEPRYLVRRGKLRMYALRGRQTGDELIWARALWDSGAADLLEAYKTAPPDRSEAITLNDLLWRVVRDPEAGAERYQVAAKLAELAGRHWTAYTTVNTLGVARYRVGDDRGAVEALTASDKLMPDHPAPVAFLAMAYHRLGEPAQAKDYLTRTRKVLMDPRYAGDSESVEILREAELTIEGKTATRSIAPPPRPK